jgi:hypothetical protein
MAGFDRFVRTELLIGADGLVRLANSSVAIFGVGGVGSYAAEALARSGVGKMTLIDHDRIDATNINRQIHALTQTIGQAKTEVMKQRIQAINPACDVVIMTAFYKPEHAALFFHSKYDYVVDAVDTVSAKIHLAIQCHERGIPIISSMGAANKLDPTLFDVVDIYKTKVDPLARIMRKKLKEHRIPRLKVVCSRERPYADVQHTPHHRSVPGSISFVPPVVGMIMAGEVIRDLVGVRVEVSA